MSTLLGSTWPTIRRPMRERMAVRLTEGEHGRGPAFELGQESPRAQDRHHALTEPVGLFEVRVTGEDELVEAEALVFGDAVRDLFVGPDDRRADAAAHEPDAGPDVRGDGELLAIATVQLRHPSLTDRLRRGEVALRGLDRVGVHAVEELVGHGPGFLGSGPRDDVEADAELQRPAGVRGEL